MSQGKNFHIAIFGNFCCCRLMNIFLTQLWTVNLLIHKPQPRLIHYSIVIINYPFYVFHYPYLLSLCIQSYHVAFMILRKILVSLNTFLEMITTRDAIIHYEHFKNVLSQFLLLLLM